MSDPHSDELEDMIRDEEDFDESMQRDLAEIDAEHQGTRLCLDISAGQSAPCGSTVCEVPGPLDLRQPGLGLVNLEAVDGADADPS